MVGGLKKTVENGRNVRFSRCEFGIDNPLRANCLREWWIRFPAYILPERTAGSRHRHGRKPTVDARHSVSLIALINKGQSGGGQGPGERAIERERERVGRRREGKKRRLEGRRRTWWNEGPVGAGFLSAISHLPHKQIAIFNAIVSQSFLILVCRRMMPRFASGSLLSDSRKYILRVWPDTGGNEEEGGGRGLPPTPTSIPTFHAWETMQFHGFFISKVSRVSVVSRGRADTQSTLRYRPELISRFRDRERDSDPDSDRSPLPFRRVEILFHRLIYLFLFRRCF